jgi:hypothetical protein
LGCGLPTLFSLSPLCWLFVIRECEGKARGPKKLSFAEKVKHFQLIGKEHEMDFTKNEKIPEGLRIIQLQVNCKNNWVIVQFLHQ